MIAAAVLTLGTAHAAELTILNTGSKTGGFSQQSLAYYTDLATEYDTVNLVNPGNRCVAFNSILPTLDGPVLMPWGSDLEAVGQTGGCATFDVTTAPIVRFVEKYQYMCQMDTDLDITEDSGKIGHNVPKNGPFSKTVEGINESFGTDHRGVAYDGWGAAKIALLNGEIDYVIVSPPGHEQIAEQGGICKFELSRGENSLYNLNPEGNNLVSSNIDAWVGYNMTEEQAKDLQSKLKEAHYSCDTAISKWQQGCDSEGTAIQKSEWDINETHIERWNDSVEWNKMD